MEGSVLYGADFNGIQSYIFEVPKLRQMIGGSALVREVTEEWPGEQLSRYQDAEILHAGGGSLTAVFGTDEAAADFDARLRGHADQLIGFDPFSSAWVPVGESFAGAWSALGQELARAKVTGRAQADPGASPLTATCGACAARSAMRPVGEPADGGKDGDLCPACRARHAHSEMPTLMRALRQAAGSPEVSLALEYDFEKIASASKQRMLGLVVADGNDIGRLVADHLRQAQGAESKSALKDIALELRRRFSAALLESLQEVCGDKTPCRPIVAGGDDIAVVVPAEMAIPLALRLVHKVEASGAIAGRERLRVAAGVCLFKKGYPFHAARRLAEGALESAKSRARLSETSALDWHVVQAGASAELEDVRAIELLRTLPAGDGATTTYHLTGRPYALGHGAADADVLGGVVTALDRGFGDTRRQALREMALAPAEEAARREDLRARLRGADRSTFERILQAHGGNTIFVRRERAGRDAFVTYVLDAMELQAFESDRAEDWGWSS